MVTIGMPAVLVASLLQAPAPAVAAATPATTAATASASAGTTTRVTPQITAPATATSTTADTPSGPSALDELPVPHGWQDAEAPLSVLDAAHPGTLNDLGLYRLVATGTSTAIATKVGTSQSGAGNTRVFPVQVNATNYSVMLTREPAGNGGSGAITLTWLTATAPAYAPSPVTAAAFVYDGAAADIALQTRAGGIYLFPPTLMFDGHTMLELASAWLGRQNVPPNLTAVPPTGDVDPATIYETTAPVLSAILLATDPDCTKTCYGIDNGSTRLGTLTVDPDVIIFANTQGDETVIHHVALGYSKPATLSAATPPSQPLMVFIAGGVAYALPTADRAGHALDTLAYAPDRDTATSWAVLPESTITAAQQANHPEGPRIVPEAVYEFLRSHNPTTFDPADFTVQNTFNPEEVAAQLSNGSIPVNLDDPKTRLDTGTLSYVFHSPNASNYYVWNAQDARYAATQSADRDPAVTAVAQGYAQTSEPSVWAPVLAIQYGVGAHSIRLVPLGDSLWFGLYGRMAEGPLTRHRPTSSTMPLIVDGITVFTAASSKDVTFDDPSVLTISGSTLHYRSDSKPVATVGYGRVEYSDGTVGPDVFAVQTTDGVSSRGPVHLFSTAGGLTAPMQVGIDTLFQPLVDAGTDAERQHQAAYGDLIQTYQLAGAFPGHGLNGIRSQVGYAVSAKAAMQRGVQFHFRSGGSALTPTLAKQFYDEHAVDDALVTSVSNTQVLHDLHQVAIERTTIDEQYQNTASGATLTIGGGVWPKLPSDDALVPHLGSTAGTGRPATDLDVAMAQSVVAWMADEARFEAPAGTHAVDTNPSMAQDYRTLYDRLSNKYPSSTAAQQTLAVQNAYELLGVSNRQLQRLRTGGFVTLGTTTTGPDGYHQRTAYTCAGTACDALTAALELRATFQPDIDRYHFAYKMLATPSSNTDVNDLAWALQSGYLPDALLTSAGAETKAASLGRWYLQTTTLTGSPELSWRLAQIADRLVFTEYPFWAQHVADREPTHALEASIQKVMSLLSALDTALAASVNADVLQSGIAVQVNSVKVGDVTAAQFADATLAVFTYLWAVMRSIERAIGFGASTYKNWASIADALKSLVTNYDSLAKFRDAMLSYYTSKINAFALNTAALEDAFKAGLAAAGQPGYNLLIKINDAGMIGSLSVVLGIVLMGTHLKLWEGQQDGLTISQLLSVVGNIVIIGSTAEHFFRLAAVYMAFKTDSLKQGVKWFLRKFGFNEAMQVNLAITRSEQYRIGQVAKWLTDDLGKLGPHGTLDARTVKQVLTNFGFVGEPIVIDGRPSGDTQLDVIARSVEEIRYDSLAESRLLGAVGISNDRGMLPGVISELLHDTNVAGYVRDLKVDRLADRLDVVDLLGQQSRAGEVMWAQAIIDEYRTSSTLLSTPDRIAAAVAAGTGRYLDVPPDRPTAAAQAEIDSVVFDSVSSSSAERSIENGNGRAYARQVISTLVKHLEDATAGGTVTWNPWARSIAVFVQGLMSLCDVTMGMVFILEGAFAIADGETNPFAIASSTLNMAAGVLFLLSGIIEMSGSEVGGVVMLAGFLLMLVVLGISQLLAFLAYKFPSATDYDPWLRAWAQGAEATGLLAAGQESVAALLYWHNKTLHGDSFPTNCAPDASTCTHDVATPAPSRFASMLTQANGPCVSVAPGTTNAVLAPCDYTGNQSGAQGPQQLYLLPNMGGDTVHVETPSGACLAPSSGSRGASIVAESCDRSSDLQNWTVVTSDVDRTSTLHTYRDQCLDSAYSVSSAGTALVQGPCTGSATQSWVRSGVSQVSVQLRQAASQACAADRYLSPSAPEMLAACVASSDRTFTITANADGKTALLRLPQGWLCLGVADSSRSNGAAVQGTPCDVTSDAQRWFVATNPDGSGTLRNEHSAMCLDTADGGTNVTTGLVQGTCTGSGTQHWFEDVVPPATLTTFSALGTPYCATVDHGRNDGAMLLAGCDPFNDRSIALYANFNGTGAELVLLGSRLPVCLDSQREDANGVMGAYGTTCADLPTQMWSFTPVSGSPDTYQIVNGSTHACLDHPDNNVAPLTPVTITTCSSTRRAQQWVQRLDSTARPRILSQAGSGHCAAVSHWAAPGSAVTLTDCSVALAPTVDRIYIAEPVLGGDGTADVTIRLPNGSCLDGGGGVAGSPVSAQHCRDVASQGWTQTGGALVNDDTGLCLDTWASGTALATPVITIGCNGTRTQQWGLAALGPSGPVG
jgi:hypothetical protein